MPNNNPIEFHNNLANSWENRYNNGAFANRYKNITSVLINKVKPKSRWLDLGCGTGTLARFTNSLGASVIGVDASDEMIKSCKKLSKNIKQTENLIFEKIENAEQLPFNNASFDGIICSSLIEYLNEPKLCIQEISRVLKENGTFIISVPNKKSIVRQIIKKLFDITKLIFGTGIPGWVKHSRNEYNSSTFINILQTNNLLVSNINYFGLPSWFPASHIQSLGSLILVVGDKEQP